jgi:hypothetical protein
MNDPEISDLMTRATEEADPRFLETAKRFIAEMETPGGFSQESFDLLMELNLLMPPSLKRVITLSIEDAGLIPEPDGLDDNGQPVISLVALAQFLDVPAEALVGYARAEQKRSLELGLPTAPLLVHPSRVTPLEKKSNDPV